ncbi:MAG: dTDP-4-dehydrorhamnose reductase [Zoogloeaceae bacterium]|jgi:dTDP-4-dehydrorhamnose reductase|nr:dTDP-4-dehydrorhamnose reductase [Zoogloeaceae bacterium]
MTQRPILVTGAQGQVGFELQRALALLGPVLALDRQACDLSDPAALKGLVIGHRPWAVVNAAAYTAVDKAETETARAEIINAVAPGALGEAAAAIDALVVHYSTDYVFDGVSGQPYRESDAPNPLNVYGRTKLMGERALAAANARHLIFRTSWVFGAHGDNFIKTMLRLAAEWTTLKVVSDQFGAPTPAALIADVTAQILGQYLRGRKETFPYGLYHLTAAGATSWRHYAAHVIDAAHAAGRPLRLTSDGLVPVPTVDYPLPARRPASSRLDCARLETTFGLCLPPWENGVDHVLAQLLAQSQ